MLLKHPQFRYLMPIVLVIAFGCRDSQTAAPQADEEKVVKTTLTITDSGFWDAMAEGYEEKAHPISLAFSAQMLKHLPVESGTQFLDVATGTGAAALLAADRGADVIAIDFSEGMLQRLRSRRIPNIQALQMDGQALTLDDSMFDVTVSVFGVMLFEDWNEGLREMVRVTKPGGTVAVMTWNSPHGAGGNQLIATIGAELFPEVTFPQPAGGMVALSDPKRLSSAMLHAGCEEPTIRQLNEDYRFSPEDIFKGNPWKSRLSMDQQRRIHQAILDRYGETLKDGLLVLETSAILCVATKPK